MVARLRGVIVKAVSMPSRTATSFAIGGLRGSTASSSSCLILDCKVEITDPPPPPPPPPSEGDPYFGFYSRPQTVHRTSNTTEKESCVYLGLQRKHHLSRVHLLLRRQLNENSADKHFVLKFRLVHNKQMKQFVSI